MGRATVCLASLLLIVTFLLVSADTESLIDVQTGHAASGSTLSAHCCKQEEKAVARPAHPVGDLVDLASAEEQGQKPNSHWSNKKKIDDDDDDDDDHDNDDGGGNGDDDNDGGDDNGQSNIKHDSDSDSGHDSHSDHDSERDDDDDNSKSRKKKKRSTPEKKGVVGGNR